MENSSSLKLDPTTTEEKLDTTHDFIEHLNHSTMNAFIDNELKGEGDARVISADTLYSLLSSSQLEPEPEVGSDHSINELFSAFTIESDTELAPNNADSSSLKLDTEKFTSRLYRIQRRRNVLNCDDTSLRDLLSGDEEQNWKSIESTYSPNFPRILAEETRHRTEVNLLRNAGFTARSAVDISETDFHLAVLRARSLKQARGERTLRENDTTVKSAARRVVVPRTQLQKAKQRETKQENVTKRRHVEIQENKLKGFLSFYKTSTVKMGRGHKRKLPYAEEWQPESDEDYTS